MPSPFPPSCAAHFIPERRLAAGGYGTVWLATQIGLKRKVVVKLLHADLGCDEQLKRFTAEAQVAALLRHPNIVVLLDHGVGDGVPWIAYEFVDGISLRQRLDQGPLPWQEACAAAMQVAAALEEAHSKAVLHRDVKPDNVMRAGPELYKLTDFGIAHWQGSGVQTAAGIILGTPAYISPGQIQGLAPGIETDLYALGTTLFELLTGRLPFWDDNLLLLFQKRLTTRCPAPSSIQPGLPRAVDCMVLKALEVNRDARFATATAFKEELERVLDGGQGQGPPTRASALRPASPATQTERLARPATEPAPPAPTTPVVPGPLRPGDARAVLIACAIAALALLATLFPLRPAPVPSASSSPAASAPPERASSSAPGALERARAFRESVFGSCPRRGGEVPSVPQPASVAHLLGQLRQLAYDRSLDGVDMQIWLVLDDAVAQLCTDIKELRKSGERKSQEYALRNLEAACAVLDGTAYRQSFLLDVRARAAAFRGDRAAALAAYTSALLGLDRARSGPASSRVLFHEIYLASELLGHTHTIDFLGRGGLAVARMLPAFSTEATRSAALGVISRGLELSRLEPDRSTPRLPAATLAVLKACRQLLVDPRAASETLTAASSAAKRFCAYFPRDCDILADGVQIVQLRDDIADLCKDKHLPPPPAIGPCSGRSGAPPSSPAPR